VGRMGEVSGSSCVSVTYMDVWRIRHIEATGQSISTRTVDVCGKYQRGRLLSNEIKLASLRSLMISAWRETKNVLEVMEQALA